MRGAKSKHREATRRAHRREAGSGGAEVIGVTSLKGRPSRASVPWTPVKLQRHNELGLEHGRVVYRVSVVLDPAESRAVTTRKDLFAGEGIPIDPWVELAGAAVFFDTPLQIAGMAIADDDMAARFTCRPEQYEPIVRAVDE